MKRIMDKIKQISSFLDELEEIVPNSLERYTSDKTKKAACERYVEKIMESVTDLAFLIIKINKFKIPDDDIDAFNILLENKIIDGNLTSKLKDAKGMRNIISHQYGSIDDGIVFNSIKEELGKDVREFIGIIRKKYRG